MVSDIDYAGLLDGNLRNPVTVEEMKMIEDTGVTMGISRLTMMENAGGRIANFIFQNLTRFKSSHDRPRVLFVAGTGNNGGDSFVAARHLVYWKDDCDVSVALIGKAEEIRAAEARHNYGILGETSEVEIITVESEKEIEAFSKLIADSDIIVVAIFGTGFKGEPRPLQGRIIHMINEKSNASIISVDVPSGLEADSGDFKLAVRSNYTITMHSPKVGMMKTEAATGLCGSILIANIGIPL